MTKEEIIEGERIICEFMKLTAGSIYCYPPFGGQPVLRKHSKYHSSWDWLYPVIKKIAGEIINMECKSKKEFNGLLKNWTPIANSLEKVKDIKEIFPKVVQFIQWYNTTQTPKP